ncbi:unnamed protein product, partial [marine sediment metagenome]
MNNIAAETIGDWAPIALLMAIYTAFFLRYESRIRRRIKEEYEKEMSKIDSDS